MSEDSGSDFEDLENGVAINEALNGKMDMLIKEYKRRVGDWKQIGEMSAQEGVQPLSFAGYELLATAFLHLKPVPSKSGNHRTTSDGTAATWNMGPFAWCFLLLQWNLIARSVSVGMIMLTHIAWKVRVLVTEINKNESSYHF
jgi:hypothetical protein